MSPENNNQKLETQQFADYVNQMVIAKYQELFDKISSGQAAIQISDLNELNFKKFLNVYAAIIQSDEMDINTAKIICFSTGTKCICGEFMSMTGTSLNDW